MLHLRLAAVVAALTLPLAAQAAEPFGEILPGSPSEQVFSASRDGLQGLAVPIATFGRTNNCTLVAELFRDHTLLARAQWSAATLVDNAEIELPCPVQAQSRGLTYRLVLRSPDASSGNAVTGWRDPDRGLRCRPAFVGDTLMLGEITAGSRVVQTFTSDADGLCGVQVLLTDFGRRNRGSVRLRAFDPLAGRELAMLVVDAATVGNEDWRALSFPAVPDSRGRTFTLELDTADGAPGTAVTAYLDRGAGYRGELSRGGVPRLGRLMLTMSHGRTGWSAATVLGVGLGALALLQFGRAALARRRREPAAPPLLLAMASVAALGVGFAYGRNLAWLFWLAGLVGCVALLGRAARAGGRRRMFAVQGAMVPLLLFLGLAAMEPFGGAAAAAAGPRPGQSDTQTADLDLRSAPWSFERAKGDPEAFRRWWQRLTGEWNAGDRGCALVQRPDPLGELPFVLQPDSRTQFFESTIRVNNLGFRGPDTTRAKGSAFRIVCIGESTTMGQTLFAEDRPWPEVLQQLLNETPRQRPIEVINAGWASYDVRHSAIRLRRFVLDLEPDLLVVYHGYNGFWMLLPDVAPALVAGGGVPRPVARPSWLLADAEYGLAVAAFRAALTRTPPATVGTSSANACADAYREILSLCRERGTRVALCSFNMAVRADSPAEVSEFYRAGFPQLERQLAANALQTGLLQELATADGRVTYVDSGAGLDGVYADAFVDLVHFTQAGRERLARNVAAGIAGLLPR